MQFSILTILQLSLSLKVIRLKQAAWLAQLGERQSAEWEVTGLNPGRTNTQGVQITEKKVLPL